MSQSADDLTHRFEYHPPSNESVALEHANCRSIVLAAALNLDSRLPACRETSLVMTKLEEALFWANAAVARHQVSAKNPSTE